ncbi:MAG: hypothetical protein ACRDTC_16125, partial [Pseudonocardiaceae bacterium]
MSDLGPSTRFRGVALGMLAAGGVFLPLAALVLSSFGLLPGTAEGIDPQTRNDLAALAAYSASGTLPQSAELSSSVLADITAADGRPDPAVGIPAGALYIPPVVLTAYQRAEQALALQQPGCAVNWTLLAGLGRVISDHGSGSLDATGNSTRPILGPRLNGSPGIATIHDTDGGRLDGDAEWDRAAGPLQIIPSVWLRVGADSDGDGYSNPHNVFDAALAAGRYVCEGDSDLRGVAEQARAVFRYQRSDVFVRAVMAWTQAYGPRLVPVPAPEPALPPVQEIPPQVDTPPPPASPPPGEPQAPQPVLPPPVAPPPSTTSPPPSTTTTPPPSTTSPPPSTTTPPPSTTTPPPSTTTPPPSTTTPPPSTTTPPPSTTSPPPSTTSPPPSTTSPPPSTTS